MPDSDPLLEYDLEAIPRETPGDVTTIVLVSTIFAANTQRIVLDKDPEKNRDAITLLSETLRHQSDSAVRRSIARAEGFSLLTRQYVHRRAPPLVRVELRRIGECQVCREPAALLNGKRMPHCPKCAAIMRPDKAWESVAWAAFEYGKKHGYTDGQLIHLIARRTGLPAYVNPDADEERSEARESAALYAVRHKMVGPEVLEWAAAAGASKDQIKRARRKMEADDDDEG